MAEWYTDFSEYTLDVQPSDWTEIFGAGYASATVVDSYGEEGGTSLQLTRDSSGIYYIKWDTPGDLANVDVLVKFKVPSTLNYAQRSVRIMARGSGSDGSENGFAAIYYPYYTEAYGRLYSYVAGTSAQLGSNFYPSSAGSSFWVRFNVSGAAGDVAVKAKVWATSAEEPVGWDRKSSSSASLSSGWVGIGSYDNEVYSDLIDYVAISTDGAAPSPVESSEFSANCLLPGMMVNGTFDAPVHFEGEFSLPALQAGGTVALSFWGAATFPALQANGTMGWVGGVQLPALQITSTFLRTTHFNGGAVFPALQAAGATGFISRITLPAVQADGDFAVQRDFAGNALLPRMQATGMFSAGRAFNAAVTLPSLRSIGVFTRSASFAGTVILPALRVSGEALGGHNFTGNIELPAMQSTGVFTIVWDLDVDIDLPALLASGTFAVAGRFDDLVLRYTPPA